MTRDFTLERYRELLHTLVDSRGAEIFGVARWIEEQPPRGVLLRHDVDRLPHNSLAVAHAEHDAGIRSTFYFRSTRGSFEPAVIEQIAEMGHEIGYHYEDLAAARGDHSGALASFERNLERLRELAPVKTIAMHGRPLSPHDSRTLWERADFRKYGIIGEAFLTIDYGGTYYFTDTGRSWSTRAVNLRDHVRGALPAEVATTAELMSFVRNRADATRIALVTHPERWAPSTGAYVRSALSDVLVNLAKRLLIAVRRVS